MIDPHFTIAIVALLCMACSAIAYLIGHRHGHECGYEAGCADEITRHKPKIIEAKVQAAKIARTLCLAELNRERLETAQRNLS